MGIRNLKKFIEEKLKLPEDFQLRKCDVIFDGDSVCHQIYKKTGYACQFGGEYDRFYRYCIQLFELFSQCEINVLVVFDGAQLDDRKLSTLLNRATDSIEKSLDNTGEVELSPLLLRQTFLNVLDVMKIPYVSALGEGDDESVSLANHLNCYLVGEDSDYYCYNLHRGYIPFNFIDIDRQKKDRLPYIPAKLYHVDSLLKQFIGLQHSTLALACCLSGNDYISRDQTWPILRHIVATVNLPERLRDDESQRIKHPYVMEWMRQFDSMEVALKELLVVIKSEPEQIEVEKNLRVALQSYIKPSDTLIYRFIVPNNQKLLTDPYFNQRARDYLDTLDMNDDQLRTQLNTNSEKILSKRGHPVPLFILDAMSDLRLSPSFVHILIRRQLILKSYIETESEASSYDYAFPILLPCLAILLKWDQEKEDLSVTINRRVEDRMELRTYHLDDYFIDIPELDQIPSMSLDERQHFVRKCLMISDDLLQRWKDIDSNYHLWLMIIRDWYNKRQLQPVYLYAIIVCLVKFVFLRNDAEFKSIRTQLDLLASAFSQNQIYQEIKPNSFRKQLQKLNDMYATEMKMNTYDNRITCELNCLQTIYIYSLQVNNFFNQPYACPIQPHYFISGSLFYAFVQHYKSKSNLVEAIRALFQNERLILNFIHNLYEFISFDK